MAVVSGNVVKVAAVWRMWDFSECINTFHVRAEDNFDDDLFMQDVVNWLESAYGQFLGTISNTVAAERVEGFNVTQGAPMPVVTWDTISGGTSVGSRLPNGISCLGIFRTGVSRVVGKKYFPPMTEADLDGGLWTAALLTNVTDGCEIFADPYVNLSGLVFTPGVWRTTALTFHPFISEFVSPEPAYQRRRKPGRGS